MLIYEVFKEKIASVRIHEPIDVEWRIYTSII